MNINNNEVEIYSNKFNKMKDFERLKYLSLELEKRYFKSIDELYTIDNIINNNKDINKSCVYNLFENNKVFNLEKNILNVTSNIWNEAIVSSGIRKYLTDEQEDKITKNLGIVKSGIGNNSNTKRKDFIEPNFKNIIEYLYYIDTVKDNVIKNNLYEVINKNAMSTERKNNKPLEICNVLIFDNVNDYLLNNSVFYDNLHKSLCYIFNLSYSSNETLYYIVSRLSLTDRYITLTKEEEEEKRQKRKLKYNYIPGVEFKVFKKSIHLFFEEDIKNKINELMLEYFRSTLIESK